jgi:hypothetical protein
MIFFSEKITLLSATFSFVLFFCFFILPQKKLRGKGGVKKELLDLSEWAYLPEKVYAEKVWSLLLEEHSLPKNATTRERIAKSGTFSAWCKKYIYNPKYVFYYPQNKRVKIHAHPLERPSLLQKWYRTYIYNPARREMARQELISRDILQSRPTTPWQGLPQGLRPKKRTYIQSNGYRYEPIVQDVSI